MTKLKEITDKMAAEGYTGDGIYNFEDGAIYVGEFKDGNFHGQGTVTYPDGGSYVGEWEDDNMHGKGTLTDADGTISTGLFEDGEFVKAEGKYEFDSYSESLNHKAEALDLNTGKEVIEKHLMSQYRWVREAAAKHPIVDKEWIYLCMENILDRYILKGLINNPNCTSVIRDKITNLLEDKEKYPTESDQYEILSTRSRPQYFIAREVGSSVSVNLVAQAIINGGNWEDNNIKSADVDFEIYGPTGLIDCVMYPDASEEDIDLDDFYFDEFNTTPEEGGENLGNDMFFSFTKSMEKGKWTNYVFNLEYEFHPKYLKPIFIKESFSGIASHYEYDNKETSERIDDIVGEFEESRPCVGGACELYANTKNGLEDMYGRFDSFREEISLQNLNPKDLLDVESFLKKKYQESSNQENTELVKKEVELKTENKVLSKDSPIWEIIQHEFIHLGKESVVKKDFSEMILKKYPHIKKGTLGAQISIQVINKRGRTNYAQCSKERVCGDNKYDFLFENDDKTLCKYDKDKHGIWEIYKRDDGKLDVRSNSIISAEKKLVDDWKDNLAQYGLTEESVLELFGADLTDLADRQHGQVQIFDISPIDLKQCVKDGYVSASLTSIGKCRYGDWEALSLFLSEEEVSYEKREYEKFIDELREECTNSGVDPAAQEFQPALVLLFCDGKYIFTGVSRGPDL